MSGEGIRALGDPIEGARGPPGCFDGEVWEWEEEEGKWESGSIFAEERLEDTDECDAIMGRSAVPPKL